MSIENSINDEESRSLADLYAAMKGQEKKYFTKQRIGPFAPPQSDAQSGLDKEQIREEIKYRFGPKSPAMQYFEAVMESPYDAQNYYLSSLETYRPSKGQKGDSISSFGW